MKLYFIKNEGKRLIAAPNTVKDAWREMAAFMAERKYKPPYTRITYLEDAVEFDVGSWSEFFHLEGASTEDLKELHGGTL